MRQRLDNENTTVKDNRPGKVIQKRKRLANRETETKRGKKARLANDDNTLNALTSEFLNSGMTDWVDDLAE